MNSAKQLFLVILITVVTVPACRKTPAPTEQPAASTAVAPEYQHPQGGTTPAGETKYFKGSIGSALGLQMKLVREAERLSGAYFYQKVGTKIDLRGTVDNQGNVVLEEFDQTGKPNGVFKGTWIAGEDGLIQIAGNWTKPGSNKQTAFSLHEEPIEFSSGVEIIARQIKENSKKLKYEIDAEYPQLTGSGSPNYEKFNQSVRGLVTGKVNAFKKEMAPPEEDDSLAESSDESMGSDIGIGYTVALAKDDLISIEFGVGSYYRRAAHPNSYTEAVNFDLKNGKQLKLGDLFKPGSKFLQTISAYCIQELKKKSKEDEDSMLDDEWIQRGAWPEAENYKSWTITKKGLGINFDSYQVAPYAAGPQHVFVPYSALKDLIRSDGPVAQFVK